MWEKLCTKQDLTPDVITYFEIREHRALELLDSEPDHDGFRNEAHDDSIGRECCDPDDFHGDLRKLTGHLPRNATLRAPSLSVTKRSAPQFVRVSSRSLPFIQKFHVPLALRALQILLISGQIQPLCPHGQDMVCRVIECDTLHLFHMR